MLLLILIIVWMTSSLWYLSKGHYLFGLFLLLSGFYECTGPVLNSGIFGDDVIQAQDIFSIFATEDATFYFVSSLFIFLILVNLSYLLCAYFFPVKKIAGVVWQQSNATIFYPLIFFMFVSGVVSVATGAGSVRLLDYTTGGIGDWLVTTPFFTYGNVLLVVMVVIAVFFALEGKWRLFILIVFALAPLVNELLQTSKRQYFAPSSMFIIILILYSTKIKAKLPLSVAFTALATAFFGLQYWLRVEFTERVSAGSFFDQIIAPQLGEFTAIGSTTFYAWLDYIQGDQPLTLGWHWLYHALNTIPYIKIGDIIFPSSYGSDLFYTYLRVAPWGGLSILADAFLGFGLLGLVLLPILIGAVIWYWHGLLQKYLANGIELSVRGVYTVSLIATLILKYRSGLGDIFSSLIYFTILYFSLIYIGLLPQLYRNRRRETIS